MPKSAQNTSEVGVNHFISSTPKNSGVTCSYVFSRQNALKQGTWILHHQRHQRIERTKFTNNDLSGLFVPNEISARITLGRILNELIINFCYLSGSTCIRRYPYTKASIQQYRNRYFRLNQSQSYIWYTNEVFSIGDDFVGASGANDANIWQWSLTWRFLDRLNS